MKRVTSWPGQAAQRYESKIPTIIWYHRGRPQAFCAEARSPAVVARAEREQWHLAEQFKLHVHPPTMANHHIVSLTPLPPDVPVDRIYVDLLAYIFRHTQTFFEEREFELGGGAQIWQKLAFQSSMDFVISHPSGWTLQEQEMLRGAVIRAGMVPSAYAAKDHVHFVTEAEASVHYVMFHADLHSRLQVSVIAFLCVYKKFS